MPLRVPPSGQVYGAGVALVTVADVVLPDEFVAVTLKRYVVELLSAEIVHGEVFKLSLL